MKARFCVEITMMFNIMRSQPPILNKYIIYIVVSTLCHNCIIIVHVFLDGHTVSYAIGMLFTMACLGLYAEVQHLDSVNANK